MSHLALLAVLAVGLADPAAAAVESWHSEALGLRIVPPRGWSLAPDPQGGGATLAPRSGQARMAVISLPLPASEGDTAPDLDTLAEGARDSLQRSVDRFKLLQLRPVQVDGKPARELYFRGRVDGAGYRWVQTLFVHRDRQVLLMYAAPADTYTRLLGDYDQVIRSVRLLP